MLSVIGFLIILGPLVVVHELGHFFFAKFFGVKAEAFSVGFGPRIWSKQIGETEWRISAIPLGGYVKLLGEEPGVEISEADQKRSLQKQLPWKRFWIFFGGPLFNFLFAILIFMAILVGGEAQLGTVVGRVLPDSLIAKAGFKSGDKVLKVDGEPVTKYEEIAQKIHTKANKSVLFEIERLGESEPIKLTVLPRPEEGFSEYGEQAEVGDLEGWVPAPRSTQFGVSSAASPAGMAGAQTGDSISTFNGTPVQNWEMLESFYEALKPEENFRIEVKTSNKAVQGGLISLQGMKIVGKPFGESLGLFSSELFLDKVVADSPAEKAGLKKGDRVISISGVQVSSFVQLREAVQKMSERDGQVSMTWEREGKINSATIVPNSKTVKDALLKPVKEFTIGIMPMLVWAEPVMVSERVLNPVKLIYLATKRTVVFTWRNFVSIKKMITGDVSMSTVGGPILIGKIAGESLSRGLMAVLSTMAVLSVGLGVFNILPVPVLDGGHIALLLIEKIKGKPLSMRQLEIVQQVGLSLILLLMAVVMKNDFSRLSIFN